MRVLFWLLLIGWVVWMITRQRKPAAPASRATTVAPLEDMMACAHCGIHLPKREAVQGARGIYCSTEHCAAAHDHHPG